MMRGSEKSFSPAATLLIALALIVPEYLRSSGKSNEPYPAVILPAGAGTIRIKHGHVQLNRTHLTAPRNGEWAEVDVSAFMTPIAEHYFSRIARRNFGLPQSKRAAPEELARAAQTKSWMKARLGALGFETSRLRVVTETLTIAFPSGKQVSSKVSRKSTYELD